MSCLFLMAVKQKHTKKYLRLLGEVWHAILRITKRTTCSLLSWIERPCCLFRWKQVSTDSQKMSGYLNKKINEGVSHLYALQYRVEDVIKAVKLQICKQWMFKNSDSFPILGTIFHQIMNFFLPCCAIWINE